MTPMTMDLDEINTALSGLVGEPVELLQRRAAGGFGGWLIAPADKTHVTSRFWMTVREAPGHGIYDTPEQALVGFAAGAKRWVAKAAAKPSAVIEQVLRDRLAQGPVLVAHLMSEATAQALSWDRIDRAARRIGVVRRKNGIAGGWGWSLTDCGGPARVTENALVGQGINCNLESLK